MHISCVKPFKTVYIWRYFDSCVVLLLVQVLGAFKRVQVNIRQDVEILDMMGQGFYCHERNFIKERDG